MEFHRDSGLWLDPADWKLQHSFADWILIEKAATRTAAQEGCQSLDEAERQRLVELSGPFWGRVLGQPESLTAEEKHIAKGWPPRDVMCANLAEVTAATDPMTPEAFLEKAAAGAEWMTLAQTNLLDQRFNRLAKGQRRTQYSMEHFDRNRAGWLVATEEEKRAYRNAQLWGQHLRRPGVPLDNAVLRDKIRTLTPSGRYAEDLQHQALWMQDIFEYPLRKYGFPIAYTTGLYEYLAATLRPQGEGRANVAPAVFIHQFIKTTIFGISGTFDAAAKLSPGRLRFWEYKLCPACRFVVSRSPLDHLVDDGAGVRFIHRMVRYGGSLEPEQDEIQETIQEHRSMPDEQYLVVLDSSLVPLIANYRGPLLREKRLEFEIVAWLYDADWNPPCPCSHTARTISDETDAANPTRDSDGYAGRIRVSFGYHLYVGIYPYLVQPGFNLKDIWALNRSEDYVYHKEDLSELPLSDA